MSGYQRIKEKWFKLSLAEQLANIGSEVIRAIKLERKRQRELF